MWYSRRKGNGRTLDCCFLLADRPQGDIHIAWGYHTTKGRVQGIDATPTRDRVDNDATWNRAIKWMAVDFGFRRCPILGQRSWPCRERKSFSKLWCWTKDVPHNPYSKPKAVPETPRCPRPCRVNSTDRAHRVDVAKKANKRHRSRKPTVSSPQSRQGFVRGDSRRFRMPSIECPRKKEVKHLAKEH